MGYRLRMTMAFAVLSLISVLMFALLFLSSSYREFKADRMTSVERMTSCLAGNVYWDLHAGAPGRLDESIQRFSLGVPAPTPPAVVVLDGAANIFASTAGERPADDSEAAARLASSLALIAGGLDAAEAKTTTVESASGFISAARVERDGERLGTVLVDYPLSSLDQHFLKLFRTAIGYSLVLMLLLIGIGWLLGQRMMLPINRLRACMQRVGEGDLEVQCRGIRDDDEIGALARGFQEMLAGLREKRLLEKEMISTERLAAVGQVAAGVAHEINNPLGGMLNAISTFKHHGAEPGVTEKTMDLLERGLRQIQSTVSALLVQARVEAHALCPDDLADLHTLVAAEVRKKGIRLEWRCELQQRVFVPSTSVRQILINLLLNAIQATPRGGRVAMACVPRQAHLELRVEDEGPGVDQEEIQRLFEPFYSRTGGHGLGLWVTYQSISQLGGSIEVEPLAPGTAMQVRLPFGREERPLLGAALKGAEARR
jgi:two-component system NtrC family sensor kinase